jgi:hypothetical protein
MTLCNRCLSSLKLYSIQHYVIKYASDLRQVGGFLRIFRFPPQYSWNIVESDIKHGNVSLNELYVTFLNSSVSPRNQTDKEQGKIPGIIMQRDFRNKYLIQNTFIPNMMQSLFVLKSRQLIVHPPELSVSVSNRRHTIGSVCRLFVKWWKYQTGLRRFVVSCQISNNGTKIFYWESFQKEFTEFRRNNKCLPVSRRRSDRLVPNKEKIQQIS